MKKYPEIARQIAKAQPPRIMANGMSVNINPNRAKGKLVSAGISPGKKPPVSMVIPTTR
jgi:hypothetical protein